MSNTLDQFYTPTSYAQQCIKAVDDIYGISSFDTIIEPSAGTGAFSDHLPAHRLAIDLDPKGNNVKQQDFFEFFMPLAKNTLFIGNPPYGRRGSLATRFFNHAAKYAQVIAFILPRGFVRPALQNTLDPHFHLQCEDRCEDFILPTGETHKVRSVFQIWERSLHTRDIVTPPEEHADFQLFHRHISWITNTELADIRKAYPICIGQNNLTVKPSSEVKSGSVWFIKPLNDDVIDNFYAADFQFVKDDATAAPSLSKADIVKGYTNVKTRT